MAYSINIEGDKDGKRVKISEEVKIEGMRYVDHVIEIAPLTTQLGQTCTINWNFELSLLANGKKDVKKFHFFSEKKLETGVIRIIRLRIFPDESNRIDTYSTLEEVGLTPAA